MPSDAIVLTVEQAKTVAAIRVAEGSDYIKIVLEDPGNGCLSQDVAETLVAEAHAAGKMVIAHAAAHGAFAMALQSGADVITHIPLGSPVAAEEAAAMARDRRITAPTLAVVEGRRATLASLTSTPAPAPLLPYSRGGRAGSRRHGCPRCDRAV